MAPNSRPFHTESSKLSRGLSKGAVSVRCSLSEGRRVSWATFSIWVVGVAPTRLLLNQRRPGARDAHHAAGSYRYADRGLGGGSDGSTSSSNKETTTQPYT